MYPILFEFGFVTVFSLWLFIAIGFIAAAAIFTRLAKRLRIRLQTLSDGSFFIFTITLIFSRLFFIVLHPDIFFYRFGFTGIFKFFTIWDKGLSFWGAAVGFLLAVFLILRKGTSGDPSFSRLLDIIVPSLLIGMFFGNIGTLLDGINYGTPTDLPWGMTFRSANVKYITAIHPTQIYSATVSLGLGLGLIVLLKYLRQRGPHVLPGFVAELGLFAFSLFRFLEEFVRGDETVKFVGIRLPQFLALIGLIAGGYLLYLRFTNRRGGDQERLLVHFTEFLLSKLPLHRKNQAPQKFSRAPTALQNPALSIHPDG